MGTGSSDVTSCVQGPAWREKPTTNWKMFSKFAKALGAASLAVRDVKNDVNKAARSKHEGDVGPRGEAVSRPAVPTGSEFACAANGDFGHFHKSGQVGVTEITIGRKGGRDARLELARADAHASAPQNRSPEQRLPCLQLPMDAIERHARRERHAASPLACQRLRTPTYCQAVSVLAFV